jgi:hypothetical protein
MRDGIVTYEALRDTVARTHYLPQTTREIAALRDRLLEGPLYAETP